MKFSIEFGDMGGDSEPEFPCPKCGEECEQDDKFCDDCGAALPIAKPTTQQFSAARKQAMDKALAGESK